MATAFNTFVRSFNAQIEDPVRQHLKNVYACLTISSVAAAAGAYVHMYTDVLKDGFLSMIAATGILLYLMKTTDDGKNRQLRVSLLLAFAFLTGIGMGPFIEMAVAIDPSILVTALVGSALVFVSFSLSSLFARRGKWLYLGGTLMTALSTMMIMTLLNIFIGSVFMFKAHLYLGLFVMCGFVLYDTQLIMEKRRRGDRDFVAHSIDLFIDLIGIFRRILIILSDKERKKNNKKNDD